MSQYFLSAGGGGGGGSNVLTLTGNSGGAVGPTVGGNINVLGGNNITVVGNPGTNTLTASVTGTTNFAVQIGNASGSLTSVGLGSSGQVLTSNGAGVAPTFQTNGAGDVVGPASATDNALARFDGTTGKLIQNGIATQTDLGSINSQDGTAALPTFGFLSTAAVGVYLTGGGALGFSSGGIGWVSLDNSGTFTSLGNFTSINDTKMGGAQIVAIDSSAISLSVPTSTFQVVITNTSAPRTVTLSAISQTGQQYRIKDGSFGAATNNITVTVSGGVKTIDGLTSQVININGGYMTVMYDGTNYLIVG